MSYPIFENGAMKTYKIHSSRRHLLNVPPSARPDRIERGLRVLRALRLAIASVDAAPVARPQQAEFRFILSRKA